MDSIAIIRLSALGDIVHTIPAFNLLRTRFPRARITWFAEPAGAKLLEHINGIDEIVPTHLKQGSVADKLNVIKRLRKTYKNRFDLIIDFQGLIKSAVFSWLLCGGKGCRVLGFDKANLKEPQARFFYSIKGPLFDEKQHVIHKNMHLVRHLMRESGESRDLEAVRFPLKELPEDDGLNRFFETHQLEDKNYIVLNVGGGWPTKVLSTEQYVHLTRKLSDSSRVSGPVVILWGNEAERETAAQVSLATGAVMTEFLNFKQLIRLLRGARVTVTGDTLALHISDMVNTPSVGIFGPTSPFRNGSLLKNSIPVYEKLHCSFCYKKKCGTIECIKKIKLDRIIISTEQIYEEFY